MKNFLVSFILNCAVLACALHISNCLEVQPRSKLVTITTKNENEIKTDSNKNLNKTNGIKKRNIELGTPKPKDSDKKNKTKEEKKSYIRDVVVRTSDGKIILNNDVERYFLDYNYENANARDIVKKLKPVDADIVDNEISKMKDPSVELAKVVQKGVSMDNVEDPFYKADHDNLVTRTQLNDHHQQNSKNAKDLTSSGDDEDDGDEVVSKSKTITVKDHNTTTQYSINDGFKISDTTKGTAYKPNNGTVVKKKSTNYQGINLGDFSDIVDDDNKRLAESKIEEVVNEFGPSFANENSNEDKKEDQSNNTTESSTEKNSAWKNSGPDKKDERLQKQNNDATAGKNKEEPNEFVVDNKELAKSKNSTDLAKKANTTSSNLNGLTQSTGFKKEAKESDDVHQLQFENQNSSETNIAKQNSSIRSNNEYAIEQVSPTTLPIHSKNAVENVDSLIGALESPIDKFSSSYFKAEKENDISSKNAPLQSRTDIKEGSSESKNELIESFDQHKTTMQSRNDQKTSNTASFNPKIDKENYSPSPDTPLQSSPDTKEGPTPTESKYDLTEKFDPQNRTMQSRNDQSPSNAPIVVMNDDENGILSKDIPLQSSSTKEDFTPSESKSDLMENIKQQNTTIQSRNEADVPPLAFTNYQGNDQSITPLKSSTDMKEGFTTTEREHEPTENFEVEITSTQPKNDQTDHIEIENESMSTKNSAKDKLEGQNTTLTFKNGPFNMALAKSKTLDKHKIGKSDEQIFESPKNKNIFSAQSSDRLKNYKRILKQVRAETRRIKPFDYLFDKRRMLLKKNK